MDFICILFQSFYVRFIQVANRTKQRLSNLSRKLVELSRSTQIGQVNDAGSVISAINNTPIDRRRRNRLANHLGTLSTSSSVYDLYTRVDRILYNAYGDIISIARTAKMDYEMQYQNAENDDITLEDTQNEHIEHFLAEFCRDQPNDLIEAIRNVDISNDMATPTRMPSDVSHTNTISNNTNPEIIADVPSANQTEKSSIISIQDFGVARRSVNDVANTLDVDDGSHFIPRISSVSSNRSKTTDQIESRTLFYRKKTSSPGVFSVRSTERSQNRYESNNPNSDVLNSPRVSQFEIETSQMSHQNDVNDLNSIGNLGFNNSSLGFNLDSEHAATNGSLIGSFQPLDPEFNDFFPPNPDTENDNFFSSKYFSQQDEYDTSFNEVMDNFDEPSPSSFKMDTFLMGTSSQSQRPNIGNIRRAAAANRPISQGTIFF